MNWFLRDESGKFLWPGYGENMRVLQWIVERCEGRAQGTESPLGIMPRFEHLNWRGLEKVSEGRYAQLANIDRAAWKTELASHDELFGKLGRHLPPALEAHRGQMHQKLAS